MCFELTLSDSFSFAAYDREDAVAEAQAPTADSTAAEPLGLFGRLPAELRLEIYEYAAADTWKVQRTLAFHENGRIEGLVAETNHSIETQHSGLLYANKALSGEFLAACEKVQSHVMTIALDSNPSVFRTSAKYATQRYRIRMSQVSPPVYIPSTTERLVLRVEIHKDTARNWNIHFGNRAGHLLSCPHQYRDFSIWLRDCIADAPVLSAVAIEFLIHDDDGRPVKRRVEMQETIQYITNIIKSSSSVQELSILACSEIDSGCWHKRNDDATWPARPATGNFWVHGPGVTVNWASPSDMDSLGTVPDEELGSGFPRWVDFLKSMGAKNLVKRIKERERVKSAYWATAIDAEFR